MHAHPARVVNLHGRSEVGRAAQKDDRPGELDQPSLILIIFHFARARLVRAAARCGSAPCAPRCDDGRRAAAGRRLRARKRLPNRLRACRRVLQPRLACICVAELLLPSHAQVRLLLLDHWCDRAPRTCRGHGACRSRSAVEDVGGGAMEARLFFATLYSSPRSEVKHDDTSPLRTAATGWLALECPRGR